jgi:hypothetical protein
MSYLKGEQAVRQLLSKRYVTAGKRPIVLDEPLDPDKYKNNFYLFIEWGDISYPSRYTDDCGYWYKREVDLYLMFRGATTESLRKRAEIAAYDLVGCLRGLYKEGFPNEVGRVVFYFYMTGTPNLTGVRVTSVFDMEEEDEDARV